MRTSTNAIMAGSVVALSPFAIDKAAAQTTETSDWTNTYVGVHLGWDETELDGSPIVSCRDNGAIGGAIAGINFFQTGSFVFGVEGDIGFLGAECDDGSTSVTAVTTLSGGTSITTTTTDSRQITADLDWKASLRARAGFLVTNNMMIFVTGGVAFAKPEVTLERSIGVTVLNEFAAGGSSFSDLGTTVTRNSQSKIEYGGVIGGGVDLRITENIVARIEGLYYHFDEESFVLDADNTVNLDLSETVVRAALTFSLN